MTVPVGDVAEAADQRVSMRAPWTHYEAVLAVRDERAVPRVSFLDEVLELMIPSWDHERVKSFLGRLIEAWALDAGIEFTPVGSWTICSARRKAGAEPDECYVVGVKSRTSRPDVAIEVNWTSGGLEKLEIYRRLRVAEVFVWEAGRITVHRLQGTAYVATSESRFFPGLPFDILVRHPRSLPRPAHRVRGHPRVPGRGRAPAADRAPLSLIFPGRPCRSRPLPCVSPARAGTKGSPGRTR